MSKDCTVGLYPSDEEVRAVVERNGTKPPFILSYTVGKIGGKKIYRCSGDCMRCPLYKEIVSDEDLEMSILRQQVGLYASIGDRNAAEQLLIDYERIKANEGK